MARSKKWLGRRLLLCSVPLAIFAAALSFVGAAAWQGTIVTRYEAVMKGMSRAEVRSILGVPQKEYTEERFHYDDRANAFAPRVNEPPMWSSWVWGEGPARVVVRFENRPSPDGKRRFCVVEKNLSFINDKRDSRSWRIRRWAEKAWTAIYGPRR